jgi:hypothetical protein
MGITRTSSQSPKGYDLQNLQGPQLAARVNNYGVDSGAVNAYVVTIATVQGFALNSGTRIRFAALNANTGPSTINANGTGAVAVVGLDGQALFGGEIGTVRQDFEYNGAAWQIVDSPSDTTTRRTPGEIAGITAPSVPSFYINKFIPVPRR